MARGSRSVKPAEFLIFSFPPTGLTIIKACKIGWRGLPTSRDLSSPHRMSRVGPHPISVFIDGAYVRAVAGYHARHFEIVMGRLEANGRAPRHFATAPNVSTSDTHAVRAALRAQGWMPGRDIRVSVTAIPRSKALSSARRDNRSVIFSTGFTFRCGFVTSSRPSRGVVTLTDYG